MPKKTIQGSQESLQGFPPTSCKFAHSPQAGLPTKWTPPHQIFLNPYPHQRLLPPHLLKTFMLYPNANSTFSHSHCYCTVILPLYPLYTQVMLILTLIDVNIYRILFLALKKVRMVKIFPLLLLRFPLFNKNFPIKDFSPIPQHYLKNPFVQHRYVRIAELIVKKICNQIEISIMQV